MDTLPVVLMRAFDEGCKGYADINMHEVLHGIIGDVLDSVRLSMAVAGLSDKVVVVLSPVEDYIANNYGDD